ncbi:MAG TPA: hypothetical protein DIU15_14995 [Deltaproteobacteria bacterium]|nr:hypothetical protein [Deltaproteobacteria bacterium]HCP47347.1 hypothetical protein [Deltaproteobacteria bacterium]
MREGASVLSGTRVRSVLTGPWALPMVVAGCICSLVARRISDTGLQAYGADGAQYLEHTARLRVLKLWQNADGGVSLGFVADADAAFPPVLHLLTLPFGALFGHTAELASRTGLLWFLLLALVAGVLAHQLGASRRVAGVAAMLLMLVPAVHGMATRYYYDLPMTVFLWGSAAVLLATLRGRWSPGVGGLIAAVLLVLAVLTKWAALAFGAPILLGVVLLYGVEARSSLSWRRLGVVLSAVSAVSLLLLGAFLMASGPENSLMSMASTAYSGPHGLARLVHRGSSHLMFYPLRLVVSVISPALFACLLPALVSWLRGQRRGLPLVLTVCVGHGLFLVVGMPALDDRFLLPGLPVLAVVVALGWESMPSMHRRALGSLTLAMGLWVAWDFHAGTAGPFNQAVTLTKPTEDDVPPTSARGLGAASSMEGRGWLRVDEQGPPARAFREALWSVVARDRPSYLGVPGQKALIDPWGDLEWWRYRGLLDQVTGPREGPEVIALCPPPGHGPYESEQPDLVVNLVPPGALPALPSCLDAGRWSLSGVVRDPHTARQAVFFQPYVGPAD